MAIKLNAKSSPSEDVNETFDTSEVMRLGKLWSQARSVHPDDTTRQNAAFLDALAVFEDSVRNAALDEAAETCKGLIADWDDEAEKAGMRYCVKEIQGLKS